MNTRKSLEVEFVLKNGANPVASPEDRVRQLVDEIDRYLASMQGPGIAEVRAGIAAAHHGAVNLTAAKPSTVVSTHLAPALSALGETHSSFAAAIAGAVPHLFWETYDAYPPAEIGAAFAAGHAYTSIIGQGAPIAAGDYDLGLFLLAPQILYRDHYHLAPELYVPLTGPHGWRFQPNAALAVKPAHEPVWNEPNVPHLTKVGDVPFLSIFAWTRDVNQRAYLLPADDWETLETVPLVQLSQ